MKTNLKGRRRNRMKKKQTVLDVCPSDHARIIWWNSSAVTVVKYFDDRSADLYTANFSFFLKKSDDFSPRRSWLDRLWWKMYTCCEEFSFSQAQLGVFRAQWVNYRLLTHSWRLIQVLKRFVGSYKSIGHFKILIVLIFCDTVLKVALTKEA